MIIGLGYKARSGKDTVASYLKEHFGFRQTFFAEPLKEACEVIFRLTKDQLYGDQKFDPVPFWWDMTTREILQKFGTEAMRCNFHPDIWVRATELRVRSMNQGNVVVSDVRFINEALAVKQWGGLLVHIDRKERGEFKGGDKGHASEVELDTWTGWDYRLDNNGDLPQLYANIEIMMKELQS